MLHQFCDKHTLADTLIIELTAMSIPTFFVEGVDSLQLSALNLIRTVMNQKS